LNFGRCFDFTNRTKHSYTCIYVQNVLAIHSFISFAHFNILNV
jgi:hypothetical protein